MSKFKVNSLVRYKDYRGEEHGGYIDSIKYLGGDKNTPCYYVVDDSIILEENIIGYLLFTEPFNKEINGITYKYKIDYDGNTWYCQHTKGDTVYMYDSGNECVEKHVISGFDVDAWDNVCYTAYGMDYLFTDEELVCEEEYNKNPEIK